MGKGGQGTQETETNERKEVSLPGFFTPVSFSIGFTGGYPAVGYCALKLRAPPVFGTTGAI